MQIRLYRQKTIQALYCLEQQKSYTIYIIYTIFETYIFIIKTHKFFTKVTTNTEYFSVTLL